MKLNEKMMTSICDYYDKHVEEDITTKVKFTTEDENGNLTVFTIEKEIYKNKPTDI